MLKDTLSKQCQRVCLTTDTWTSIRQVHYMRLTAHFIDWRLQKRQPHWKRCFETIVYHCSMREATERNLWQSAPSDSG